MEYNLFSPPHHRGGSRMRCVRIEEYIRNSSNDDIKIMLGVLENMLGEYLEPTVCYSSKRFCIRIQYASPLDYFIVSELLTIMYLLTLEFNKPALLMIKKSRKNTYYYVCVG